MARRESAKGRGMAKRRAPMLDRRFLPFRQNELIEKKPQLWKLLN